VADRFGRFVVPLPSRPEYVDLRLIRSAEPLVALLAYLLTPRVSRGRRYASEGEYGPKEERSWHSV